MNGKPTYIFRVDASIDIGTGHVMRCLTLADALTERGANCYFVCRELLGNLIDFIRSRGYGVLPLAKSTVTSVEDGEELPPHYHWLETDWKTDAKQTLSALSRMDKADWLIVDHYALDYRWQQEVECVSKRLFVIDDLADRSHDCDLLLDQNLGRVGLDYKGLIPEKCEMLIGPKYALLRPDFGKLRDYSLKRRNQGSLSNILVSLGGIDKDNATGKILSSLAKASFCQSAVVRIVMGGHAPWIEEVKKIASQLPWRTEVLVNVSDMAQLMANSDLAIGAAGSTSWERCAVGLPTLMVVLAENQIEAAKALEEAGAVIVLSLDQNALDGFFENEIEIKLSLEQLKKISFNAARVCNGAGCSLVTQRLMGI